MKTKTINKQSAYTLQRTMIIYFLLISVASLMVSIEFIADTYDQKLKTDLLAGFERYSNHQISEEDVFTPINRLRSKAVLMISIILFVIIIVLTMFIRNITEPLQHMIELSKKISGGDLSKTITIHARNELSALGNVINEMSSNLQEIIMLSGNICTSGKQFISNIENNLSQKSIERIDALTVQNEIDHLKAEINLLGDVLEYFNFYTLEGQHDQ